MVPYNSQREDVNTGAKMDNNSKSKTVKIAIPSLTDFQNDDDDAETNEPPTKKTKAQVICKSFNTHTSSDYHFVFRKVLVYLVFYHLQNKF